jgi:mono/diheme cytochrome c family protein
VRRAPSFSSGSALVERAGPLIVAGAALVACRTEQTLVTPDPHLERMLEQEKLLPYDQDPRLPGGMTMLQPPDGTLPVDAPLTDPLVWSGVAGGRWAARIPIVIDRAGIEMGRRRFDTYCAACHGVLGDGKSVVADRMALRKPPDLLDGDVRAYPPGRVFQTIRQGYGLMPSYAVQLGVEETWRVVAYVAALQRSRAVRASDLPPALRAELAKEAP